MTRLWFVVCLFVASPLFAQSHPDTVAQAKAELQAQGADLSGPCGAWKIVNLTAWKLRAEGAGLLDKPSGNNCQGFATDIIAYQRPGQTAIFDVLIDGGGANTPTWNAIAPVEFDRWRPPLPVIGAPPPDPPPPVTPPVDLGPILSRLSVIEEAIGQIKREALNQQNELKRVGDLADKHEQAVERIDGYLASRPIPSGCSVRFFGCQLVVP